MGRWASASRAEIVETFEAASGDMRGEIEPTFIALRDTGKDVIEGEITRDGTTMHLHSRCAHDLELDLDDVVRLFAFAYCDELTDFHDQPRIATIVFHDQASGAERTIIYPAAE